MMGAAGDLLEGLCPVTGGNETAMLETSFARMCGVALAGALEREREQENDWRDRRCLACRGEQRPPELRIIELGDIQTGEVVMGSPSKIGKCVSCEKQGSTVSHFGEWVCSSCHVVRVSAKNRPQVLVAALERFSPEALDQGRPASGADRQPEAAVADQLAAILQPMSGETLVEAAQRVVGEREEAQQIRADLAIKVEQRGQKIQELRHQIEMGKRQSASGEEHSLLTKLREILGAGDGDIVLAARQRIDDRDRLVLWVREIHNAVGGDYDDIVGGVMDKIAALKRAKGSVQALKDLRDDLVAELGAIRVALAGDQLDFEIKRSSAVTSVAREIIANGNLVLKAWNATTDAGRLPGHRMPALLTGGEQPMGGDNGAA